MIHSAAFVRDQAGQAITRLRYAISRVELESARKNIYYANIRRVNVINGTAGRNAENAAQKNCDAAKLSMGLTSENNVAVNINRCRSFTQKGGTRLASVSVKVISFSYAYMLPHTHSFVNHIYIFFTQLINVLCILHSRGRRFAKSFSK